MKCGEEQLLKTEECTWGSPNASTRIVIVGDSIAMSYGGPLRKLAMTHGEQIQVHLEVLAGCQFSADAIDNADESVVSVCPARKQRAVDFINATKPNVVIIANSYLPKRRIGSDEQMTPGEWATSEREIVDRFRGSADTVVWVSAPPADKNIEECYGKRSSVPSECISAVTGQWTSIAHAEQGLAASMGGIWIDSRPWFCSKGLCPAFVGTTPTKRDTSHMTKAYGEKITPVIRESLAAAGVF